MRLNNNILLFLPVSSPAGKQVLYLLLSYSRSYCRNLLDVHTFFPASSAPVLPTVSAVSFGCILTAARWVLAGESSSPLGINVTLDGSIGPDWKQKVIFIELVTLIYKSFDLSIEKSTHSLVAHHCHSYLELLESSSFHVVTWLTDKHIFTAETLWKM